MIARTCRNCIYWQPHGDPDEVRAEGECRRYPPEPDDVGWPHTASQDWCGEFSISAEVGAVIVHQEE